MSEEKTQVQNARKDLDILNKMKNLPGGLVIIPLVIAVVLATFVPQVFQIGGYVTALFYEGNACMMGFFLIVCGSMIDIKQVGMPLYKGVIMTGTKFLLGVIVGLIVGKICGPEGFLGIAAQCATASIITLFLCPFITAAFDKWMQKRQKGIYSPEGWAYDKVKAN